MENISNTQDALQSDFAMQPQLDPNGRVALVSDESLQDISTEQLAHEVAQLTNGVADGHVRSILSRAVYQEHQARARQIQSTLDGITKNRPSRTRF